jgi:ubiquitin carboxyl-terminal hydrolase 5/13
MYSIINTACTNNTWEDEILACEHTLTLQPANNIKIPNKYNVTCADCNLSSNLWLCLTCGNLGCGRKLFDGSGGNNHGIEHHKQTSHPLVVKISTITPKNFGNYVVYCYACEADVKVENLDVYLYKFGIDASKGFIIKNMNIE